MPSYLIPRQLFYCYSLQETKIFFFFSQETSLDISKNVAIDLIHCD